MHYQTRRFVHDDELGVLVYHPEVDRFGHELVGRRREG
jgi:hypothetical protein